MTARRQNKSQAAPGEKSDKLPYSIELFDESNSAVERVLARAAKISLARAIFRAALAEHPDRRIILRHGSHIVSDGLQEA
jgi:hypothetical protein